MKNPLEQLRKDVRDALDLLDDDEGFQEDRAALAVLDTFRAKYEAVEVKEGKTNAVHGFLLEDDEWYGGHRNIIRALTILVPRKQEPTLLEAAEAASEHWEAEGVVFSCPEGRKFCTRMDALRTAIAKEQENE